MPRQCTHTTAINTTFNAFKTACNKTSTPNANSSTKANTITRFA